MASMMPSTPASQTGGDGSTCPCDRARNRLPAHGGLHGRYTRAMAPAVLLAQDADSSIRRATAAAATGSLVLLGWIDGVAAAAGAVG
jgi:hypothetical protein